MSNLIGQQLGQYKIISLLGKGGMATVYRARQESISRDVAVKVIKPDLAGAEMFVARFEREARTVASFSHPHILKVFDYGQFEDTVYLVIELMTGGSLSDLIQEQKSLSVPMTIKMLDQIAQALDYAHRRGVIHRDLKPQNVLLDDDQNAFLTDFGIAKVTSSGTGLTQSGIAMGTPSYMPPEQWRGETVDARADIYALGVMLFEMLTGRVPFQGDTPFSMMYKHLNDPPPSLGTIRSDISSAVDEVIYRALAKNPEDRYESAAALSAAFKEALRNGGADVGDIDLVSAEPESEPKGKISGNTPPGLARTAKGTPPGTLRTAKGTGTPVGLTRAGATSTGTAQEGKTALGEDVPAQRRGVPVAFIAVGVVLALIVIIGGILVVTSSSAANQNQTATAVQVALANTGTAANNFENSTATQAAQIVAAQAASETQIAQSVSQTSAAATQFSQAVAASQTAQVAAAIQATATAVAKTPMVTATPSATSTAANNNVSDATTQAPVAAVAQVAAATAQLAGIGGVTNTPFPTATLPPTQTQSFTPTLTPTLTATFTPTITLTPSSTLTFTPAPPALTGTGVCDTKTATVSFTIKNVGGVATGTYVVADNNGFSKEGSLSLLAGESTTLSFHGVYGIVTLIATLNGATQQFTFATQCGPKPTATPVPPTATPTLTPTARPTDTPLVPPTLPSTNSPSPTVDNGSGSTPVLTQVAVLPANTKPVLAFIAKINGRQGIYTVNGDGSNQDALTNTNNTYSPPLSWSPDRSQIAFVLRTNTGESVWVMNADGTNATRFAPAGPGTATYPAWSPDGQHIAYVGTVNGRSEIYVMNAIDGSEAHTVTNIGVKVTFLAWGSDSQHIFFLSGGVWVATLDGKSPTQVNSDTKASSLAVSPNGYKLAVVSGSAIYILDVQNKFNQTALVDNGGHPSWGPANQRLTYSSNGAIYTIYADGTGAKKIADSGIQPEWSPTGTQIAYISGGALYVIGFEGGTPHQIAANAQAPVWAP